MFLKELSEADHPALPFVAQFVLLRLRDLVGFHARLDVIDFVQFQLNDPGTQKLFLWLLLLLILLCQDDIQNLTKIIYELTIKTFLDESKRHFLKRLRGLGVIYRGISELLLLE